MIAWSVSGNISKISISLQNSNVKTLTRSMVSTTTSDSRWLVESRSLDSFAFADSDSSSGFRKLLQYPPAIRHLREICSRFVSTLLTPR